MREKNQVHRQRDRESEEMERNCFMDITTMLATLQISIRAFWNSWVKCVPPIIMQSLLRAEIPVANVYCVAPCGAGRWRQHALLAHYYYPCKYLVFDFLLTHIRAFLCLAENTIYGYVDVCVGFATISIVSFITLVFTSCSTQTKACVCLH